MCVSVHMCACMYVCLSLLCIPLLFPFPPHLEADQINFTAVENHANIVEKEAFNALWLLHTTQIAPPVLTLLSVFSVLPLYSTSQC